jgi:hypothetical protein
MDKQPEALRLADLFELEADPESLYRKAAAELRRLHEVNQELLKAINSPLICNGCQDLILDAIAKAGVSNAT